MPKFYRTAIVSNKDLLENRRTANAVGKIANQVVVNDHIKDMTITYEKEDGSTERVTLSKQDLSQIGYNEIEDESISQIIENVTLEIVSPVFVDKPATWKVKFDNKEITVKMTDEDFLETIDKKRLSFAKEDVIVADMECIAKKTERGIRTKYYVRKVHSYPKFSRVIKHLPNLFDFSE